jgi:hypothetical protein
VHAESGTVRWVADMFYEGYLPMKSLTPMIDTLAHGTSDSFLSWTGGGVRACTHTQLRRKGGGHDSLLWRADRHACTLTCVRTHAHT